jgi:peroxiredoxin
MLPPTDAGGIPSIAPVYEWACYQLAADHPSGAREANLNRVKELPDAPSNSHPEISHGWLNEKLAAHRARIDRRLPELSRAYDRLVQRIASIDRGEIGPAIGGRMPDFVMPDQRGSLVSLRSLLDRGPLAISFNRGHWCPFCKLDLRALAAALPDIERLGGHVVSIMPDSAGHTVQTFDGAPLPFPILSDIDFGYTLSLGLIYWIGADVIELYQDLGIDLERYQGNNSHFLPLAAKFVVGRDGVVKARQVDIEFRRRLEPAELLAALKELRDSR